MKSYTSFQTPFNVMAQPGENVLNFGIISDKGIVSEERVDSLIRRFEHIFLQVIGSQGDPDKKIGDIDSSDMVDSDWICKSRLDTSIQIGIS
jgi:hypothetical protein